MHWEKKLKKNWTELKKNLLKNLRICLVRLKLVLFNTNEDGLLWGKLTDLRCSSWSKRLRDPILKGYHQFRKGAFGTRLFPVVTAEIPLYSISPTLFTTNHSLYLYSRYRIHIWAQLTNKAFWQLNIFLLVYEVSFYSSYYLPTLKFFNSGLNSSRKSR